MTLQLPRQLRPIKPQNLFSQIHCIIDPDAEKKTKKIKSAATYPVSQGNYRTTFQTFRFIRVLALVPRVSRHALCGNCKDSSVVAHHLVQISVLSGKTRYA